MEYDSRLAAGPTLAASPSLAPMIVVGSSSAARARAIGQVEAAGMRLAAAVSVGDAVERIDRQVRSSAVWVELDEDEGAPLDRLLDRIDGDAKAGRYAAIVCASPAMLDVVSARLASGCVDLLVDDGRGTEVTTRAATLALALSRPAQGTRLSDVASDNSATRLRQLTDEVGRIAATLARLSNGPGTTAAHPPGGLSKPDFSASGIDAAPQVSQEQLRAIIRARRLRSRYFTDELFADPAWDMLLDLTQAEIAQVRVPVSSLCIAAAVPATTALRWIKTLTDSGLLLRRADPHDGRRVFVEMAPATSNAMRRYFAEVATPIGV